MSLEGTKTDRSVLGFFVGSSVSLGLAALYAGRRQWFQLKPQRNFTRILADNSDTPFVHPIVPHKGKDFEAAIIEQPRNIQVALQQHPYGEQIRRLLDCKMIPQQLMKVPQMPRPISECRCVMVNTVPLLKKMCQELKTVDKIGVDVEHHHLHSYYGFTCLIQISTGDIDYVVDTISLHDEMGVLSDIFSNEDILKVVHGGDNDVVWLQKDFGLYLVNVFDTTRAATVIGRIQQMNLANLLKLYCGVVTDKKFQLADWRIRPLSDAMMAYARIDAHYLCYIAGKLAEELRDIDKVQNNVQEGVMGKDSVMLQAVRRSHLLSLKLFQKVSHQLAADTGVKAIIGAFESRDRKRVLGASKLGSKTARKNQKLSSSSEEEVQSGGEGVEEGPSESSQNLFYNTAQLQADYIEQELQHHFPWSRRGGEAFLDSLYALCVWRDKVARSKDESVQFIMPNQLLMKLADQRPYEDIYQYLKITQDFAHQWMSKGKEIDEQGLYWNALKVCGTYFFFFLGSSLNQICNS
eukprot:TRINITY_DN5677_c0_g1_i8.p1 TRINITY_DN5677_c0_g1~~TRINITY_DN5677_c0_g1_i8.p1  ORF type:complete len:521 (-),score=65.52 TRINITY_DN5677_c0_g1_i8:62-1624(-)